MPENEYDITYNNQDARSSRFRDLSNHSRMASAHSRNSSLRDNLKEGKIGFFEIQDVMNKNLKQVQDQIDSIKGGEISLNNNKDREFTPKRILKSDIID